MGTGTDDRGGLGDHPGFVILGALASIATLVGLLFQIGVLGGSESSGVDDTAQGDPAACSRAELQLSQGRGPSGTQVVVTGTGFAATSRVTIRFHTDEMAPARTNGAGSFETTVVIPGSLDSFAPQQFAITASTGGCSAEVPFALTARDGQSAAPQPGACTDASIHLSDGAAPSGTEITVSGTGFQADADVELLFVTTLLAPGRTDAGGSFSTRVRIPGDYDAFAPQQFQIQASTGPCSDRIAFELTR